jgi:hypothetical protein
MREGRIDEEATVSSPDNHSFENRGIDWLAVVRTLLIQVMVLAALAVAFTGYVEWSSERAFSEFMRASEPSLASADQSPKASAAVGLPNASRVAKSALEKPAAHSSAGSSCPAHARLSAK